MTESELSVLNEQIENAFNSSETLIDFYWYVKEILKDIPISEKL